MKLMTPPRSARTKAQPTDANAPPSRRSTRASADLAVQRAPVNRSSVLAGKVRFIRMRAGLTLQELGKRSGISQSALSKIENGQLSPTYEKIVALAQGLQVEVAELFAETRPGAPVGRRAITRRGQGVLHTSPQYEYELLCGDLSGKQFVPIYTKVKAHSMQEFPSLPRHEGEEFVYIIAGAVELHTEFYEPLKLGVGDSCYFDSTMGHAFISAGAHDATLLWVTSKNALAAAGDKDSAKG